MKGRESLTQVRLFVISQTVTPQAPPHGQAPLSMEFSRQEYWSGLPFLSPGDLSNPGIEPRSPALQADSLPSKPPRKPKRREEKRKKRCGVQKKRQFQLVMNIIFGSK